MSLCLLAGCQKGELLPPEGTADKVMLDIAFCCSDMDGTTRILDAADEETVEDVNLYLYHRQSGACFRRYVRSATPIRLRLPKGEYDIYVIANYGTAMGEQSQTDVENFQFVLSEESDFEDSGVLPMSGDCTIDLDGNRAIEVELKRLVAKVDVKINMASNITDKIALQFVRLVNAPTTCRYFGTNTPTMKFIDYADREWTEGTNYSFYVLENRQGVNSAITSPKYKGGENAPKNAAYLHIKGHTDTKALDYYVYLGENTTTDFNVNRNSHYTLVIDVKGISTLDWRVELSNADRIDVSITKAVRSTTTYLPVNESLIVGSDNTLEVSVSLSKPAKWDVTIPIQGAVLLLNGNLSVIPESGGADGSIVFHPYARITVPRGSTTKTQTFYLEMRTHRGDNPTMFYNHVTIRRFITNPADRTIYRCLSDAFAVSVGKTVTIKDYPAS